MSSVTHHNPNLEIGTGTDQSRFTNSIISDNNNLEETLFKGQF